MFEAQVQQHGGQVVQGPWPQATQAAPAQAAASQSLLPSFPVVALTLDRTASRVPWYAWLVIGGYFMYRLLRSVR